jgi:hypothetical protein
VESDDVEESFIGKAYLRRSREDRYQILGRSVFGRYLFAVFVLKSGRIVRVITARDMTQKNGGYIFEMPTDQLKAEGLWVDVIPFWKWAGSPG